MKISPLYGNIQKLNILHIFIFFILKKLSIKGAKNFVSMVLNFFNKLSLLDP